MSEPKKFTIPQNVSAERAVLAGLCQYGSKASNEIAEIVSPDCFHNSDNQMFYKAVTSVLEQHDKVDVSSVMTHGSAIGLSFESKENSDYLRSLFNFPVNLENIKKNAVILKKLDIIRRGQKLARGLAYELGDMSGMESISEIIGTIEAPIIDFSMTCGDSESDKTELMGLNVGEFITHLAENKNCVTGIPSPIARYNEAIGGGRRRGGVYLKGARPKAGKSTDAINDALHVSNVLSFPVLYLDTEMSKDGQLPRILANLSNIKIKEIESGSFAENDFLKTKVIESGKILESIPFYYRKISGMAFEEVLSIIRKWVTQEVGQFEGRTKDCLVIYDYFKLMDASSLDDGMQEFQALGFQISALTDFCGKYDIPCSAYVQLNRDGITKETSDIISQSDRLLWLCSSFAFLKRKTREEMLQDGPQNGNVKLIVTAEQRFGPGLEDGNYINLIVEGDKGIIREGKTAFELQSIGNSETGFAVVEHDKEDTFDNDDDQEIKDDFNDKKYRSDGPLKKNYDNTEFPEQTKRKF